MRNPYHILDIWDVPVSVSLHIQHEGLANQADRPTMTQTAAEMRMYRGVRHNEGTALLGTVCEQYSFQMNAEKPDACPCLPCRHIDSARYYENEAEVAKAVRESGIPREDLFVTTKVWLSDFGYKNAKRVKAASKDCHMSQSVPGQSLPISPTCRLPCTMKCCSLKAAHSAHVALSHLVISPLGAGHRDVLEVSGRQDRSAPHACSRGARSTSRDLACT